MATLLSLLEGLPGFDRSVLTDLPIRSIVLDSRQATVQSLFVALPGQHQHGADFAADAVRRGAVAVISSASRPSGWPPVIPWIQTDNPRMWLPTLAARLYQFPARRLTLYGVTGTNGKTTTVYMLAAILRRAGRRVAFWSTNQVEGIPHPYRPAMTTPDSPALHEFLRQAVDTGAEDVLLEVSSHALALNRIGGLRFAAVAVTNITPDHLDFHGSFADYVAAKASIVQYVKPGGAVILNGDDPVISGWQTPAVVTRTTYGFSGTHPLTARIIESHADHSRWEWFWQNQSYGEIVLPVPGRHNIQNALAALGMALHCGIAPDVARDALAHFVPAPRRLETVTQGDITVVSDVAMNRASYEAVLATVHSLGRPVVVVNAIRGNRGPDINRDIVDVLADWADHMAFAPVIATLSTDQVASLSVDYRVRPDEQAAFLEQANRRGLAVICTDTLEAAIDAALARLPKGGILLLLGTFGMDAGLALVRDRIG
ncbi:UDP-N-acetylmuramyl-tripeptide synthetase [Sulfobacillus acidophilus TPY]|uniref:UDP-N-acetylmuramyl-tripeptide synthetase n=1 Tax=Sulfobacillus acidophilus (strain ATCC 700253 / DSM 10332 / NAL) TaxID=679936 RepID=G8U0X4_SULAD|nr:UDP-N-acetylmuramyl-tripeptide synthetase [Sulfobacillus acidophilus TPY]AEW06519.1 UDP-N-acetylmuramyl-tripeptide synthetase [Sulfobacillus acidophilus DSM 10332]